METMNVKDTTLGVKVQEFWNGLSPDEQTRLDGALRRMVDEAPDVSGHSIVETANTLGPLIYVILLFL
jgi:hypothetical protein